MSLTQIKQSIKSLENHITMQLNDDYILLLNKAFTGEITPAESAQLTAWIQQSPENEQFATELRHVWDLTGARQPVFQPDLEADFAGVQQRIRELAPAPLRVVPMGRRLLRIAAVLIFLVAAVWGGRRLFMPAAQLEFANTDTRLIELPDGSRVWLRQSGSLEFPQQFKGGERRVKLSGEAYFDVAHNPAQPFRVELSTGGFVQVLGTQFNVCALPRLDETSVLVRTGKVRYSPDGKSEGALLTRNQKAVFSHQNAKVKIAEVTSFNELAWQTGGLEFVSTPLTTVVSDLEKYYKVKIELRNAALRDCTYTAPLTNQSIDNVLKSIAVVYRMQLKKPASGQYILEGGECQ